MSNQNYVEIPVYEYNRLPIFQTNVLDSVEEINAVRATISGLRKYADYLESLCKEREDELIDQMYMSSLYSCEQRHRQMGDCRECTCCTAVDCRLFGLSSDEEIDMRLRFNED